MVGAVRIAVALMVMAAEIDVSMSVRIFEELTQTQPKPNVAHPNTAEYLEAFWYDVPKIAALSEQKWEDFDQIRLDRQRGRITKVDWASDVPCQETTGKRLLLPLMGRTPRAYPNYSKIFGAQLGGESFVSMSASEETDGNEELDPEVNREEVGRSTESLTEGIQKETPELKRKRMQEDPTGRSTVSGEELGGPLVNDHAACGDLMRQIRGGTRMMPEVTELAFPDKFSESAHADTVAVARKIS
ncbi:hypothetical protein Bca4012_075370 [Brassica carinata]